MANRRSLEDRKAIYEEIKMLRVDKGMQYKDIGKHLHVAQGTLFAIKKEFGDFEKDKSLLEQEDFENGVIDAIKNDIKTEEITVALLTKKKDPLNALFVTFEIPAGIEGDMRQLMIEWNIFKRLEVTELNR